MTATLITNPDRIPNNANIGVLHRPSKHKLIVTPAGPNRDYLIQQGQPVFTGRDHQHELPIGQIQYECKDGAYQYGGADEDQGEEQEAAELYENDDKKSGTYWDIQMTAGQAATRQQQLSKLRENKKQARLQQFQKITKLNVSSWVRRKINVEQEEGLKRGGVVDVMKKSQVPDYSKMFMKSMQKKRIAQKQQLQTMFQKENLKPECNHQQGKSSKSKIKKQSKVVESKKSIHKSLSQRMKQQQSSQCKAFKSNNIIKKNKPPQKPKSVQLKRQLHSDQQYLKKDDHNKNQCSSYFVDKFDLNPLGIEPTSQNHYTLKQLEQFSLLQRLRRKEEIDIESQPMLKINNVQVRQSTPTTCKTSLQKGATNDKQRVIYQKQRFNSALMSIVKDKVKKKNIEASWLNVAQAQQTKHQFEGCIEQNRFPVNSPFYRKPKQYSKFLSNIMSCLNQFD